MPPSADGSRTAELILLDGRCRGGAGSVRLERWNVQPTAFLPRSQRDLGELDTLRALEEIVGERLVRRDVPQKHLPLHLEGVIEVAVVGDVLPVRVEIDRV